MQGNITLDGAVDIHAHCGPSLFDRRVDGYEFAVEAAQAGMDAIVMKEHHLPTVYGVSYINQLLNATEPATGVSSDDIDVFGSAAMNYCVGGFNPFMVEVVLEYGSAVVWAPTIDAKNHGERTNGVGAYLGKDDVGEEYQDVEGLYALTDGGELKEDVKLCLEKIAAHDAVFSVGHLTYDETEAMIEYIADLGHDKIIVDHPNYYITDFSPEQQQQLVDLGAKINFQFASMSPKFYWQSPAELAESIRQLGVDNCLISSDMGQVANPSSPEGLRICGELLLENGFSNAEYRTLVETNPKAMLGLD